MNDADLKATGMFQYGPTNVATVAYDQGGGLFEARSSLMGVGCTFLLVTKKK